MLLNRPTGDGRPQLESKILAAALRQSLSRRDTEGTLLAHSELTKLMAAHGQDFPGLEQLQSGHVSIPALRVIEPPPVEETAEPAAGESDIDSAGASVDQSYPGHEAVAVDGVAAGSPLDYLDFDDSQSGTEEPDNVDQKAEELAGRLAGRVAPDPESRSYYSRLAASPIDSAEIIHLCYIRAIRLLLRSQYLDGKAKALNAHEFRKHLRNLGIAYNILFDVSTRLDYDLRLLGLREPLSGKHLTVPEDAKTDATGKAKLSLVEIVVLSRTFGADTLLSAVSAARSLPEGEFWEYLAQTGAFTQVDFEALHFGARLIRHGLVSVVQFEQAFQSVRNSGYSLEDILVHSGWVDAERLHLLNEETGESAEPAFQFVEARVDNAPRPAQENIKVGGNLPSWASHMDWGGEEGVAAESGENGPGLSAPPVESAEKAAASQIMDYLEPQTSFEPEPLPESQTQEFAPPEHESLPVIPQDFAVESEPLSVALPQDDAHCAVALDSAVPDFSSAGDVALPPESELSPAFAQTAALVDWELPTTPEQGTGQEGVCETDWSVVTPPATIAAQYTPVTEYGPPVDDSNIVTDWGAVHDDRGQAQPQMPSVKPESSTTRNHPAELFETPGVDGYYIVPDPMESLPKPTTESSWEEAVARALSESAVTPASNTPAPKSPEPENFVPAAEPLLEEIGEAPGGSWLSAVEQMLEPASVADKGSSMPVEAGTTKDITEIPATIEVSEEAPSVTDGPIDADSIDNAAEITATIEVSEDEQKTDVPIEASPIDNVAKNPATIEVPEIEQEASLEAAAEPGSAAGTIPDSAIPAKDARRPREKQARKPRSRREAKNLIQLSKLGTESRTQSDHGESPAAAVPAETTSDSQESAPAEAAVPDSEALPAETAKGQEVPPSQIPNPPEQAQPIDALSFLNISGFVSPLPDAESRDQLLFGDPFSNLDSAELLTGDSRLSSADNQTELENQSLSNATGPSISFAPPPDHEPVMQVPVAEESTEAPVSPAHFLQPVPVEAPVAQQFEPRPVTDVIDTTPDEPPGWSRYKLFFGESEKSLPVSGKIAKIGRNRQSVDVAIQEPAVSREHCQLEIAENGVVLRDLTSRHGTYIIRGKTEFRANHDNPMKLEHGDCIRLGKPGAPALEWVDTKQEIDDNAPTDTFAAIPGTTDYESLRDTLPRQPKASPLKLEVLKSTSEESDEEVAKPEDSGIRNVDSNLAAAATLMAMSSGLGSDSIEAIMAAMLGPAAPPPPLSSIPPAEPTEPNSQEDADLAAAAAAMAASSGLSKDAIDSIIAAMRTAKPSSLRQTNTPEQKNSEAKPADKINSDEGMPSPPEPPHSTEPDSAEPLVVEVPLVPIAVSPVDLESKSDDTQTDTDGSHDTEKSGNGSRIRATAENPYADIDALMAAIDAEVATARKVIDEEDRKRKRLRQS